MQRVFMFMFILIIITILILAGIYYVIDRASDTLM